MESNLRLWLFTVIISVIMSAIFCESNSADDNSNVINIRWSMVRIDKDDNPPKPKILRQNATIKTGDRIKMYLEANNPCFFYLFYQGPEGGLQLLFPYKLPSSSIEGGDIVTVPYGDQWFEFDNKTGTEIFHALISPFPLKSIETLYEDYVLRKSDNQQLESRILSAILQLNDDKRPLSSRAERPVAIGGTIRSANINGTEEMHKEFVGLTEHISTTKVFCRTYTIDHK